MKFELIKSPDSDNEFDNTEIVYRFEATTIGDIKLEIKDFLKGCGFAESTIQDAFGDSE